MGRCSINWHEYVDLEYKNNVSQECWHESQLPWRRVGGSEPCLSATDVRV